MHLRQNIRSDEQIQEKKMNRAHLFMRFAVVAYFMFVPAFASEQMPKFSDFWVPIYSGPEAGLNLASRKAYEYRTRLRAAATQPLNFGGHYHLAEWGCGTDCLTGAIIDALTGSVWFLPAINGHGMDTEIEGYKALAFRGDSNLLVISGAVDDDQVRKGWHYFLFATNNLREIKFVEWNPKADAVQAAPPVDLQKWTAEKENTPAGSLTTRVPASPRAVLAIPAESIPSSQNSKSSTDSSPPLLLVVLVGFVILMFVLRMRDRKIRTKKVLEAVYATMEQYKRALVRKRFQTLRHDDYGNLGEGTTLLC
jgi:hypothetical protein